MGANSILQRQGPGVTVPNLFICTLYCCTMMESCDVSTIFLHSLCTTLCHNVYFISSSLGPLLVDCNPRKLLIRSTSYLAGVLLMTQGCACHVQIFPILHQMFLPLPFRSKPQQLSFATYTAVEKWGST